MFKVNDIVMYGMTGICKITDIQNCRLINGDEKEYYVLKPVYSKNTVIKIPTDNKKILIRNIISKQKVLELISSIKDKDVTWIDDERERNETYKAMIKSGNCEDMIEVIRSLYTNSKARKAKGKKIYKIDEDTFKTAERLLNEEFGAVLGIDPSDVPEYIKNHI